MAYTLVYKYVMCVCVLRSGRVEEGGATGIYVVWSGQHIHILPARPLLVADMCVPWSPMSSMVW